MRSTRGDGQLSLFEREGPFWNEFPAAVRQQVVDWLASLMLGLVDEQDPEEQKDPEHERED